MTSECSMSTDESVYTFSYKKSSLIMTRAGEEQHNPSNVMYDPLGLLGRGPRRLLKKEFQAFEYYDSNPVEVQGFREPLVRHVGPTVQISNGSSHYISNEVEVIIH